MDSNAFEHSLFLMLMCQGIHLLTASIALVTRGTGLHPLDVNTKIPEGAPMCPAWVKSSWALNSMGAIKNCVMCISTNTFFFSDSVRFSKENCCPKAVKDSYKHKICPNHLFNTNPSDSPRFCHRYQSLLGKLALSPCCILTSHCLYPLHSGIQ